MLCLVPRKFEGKCKGKKIQTKSRMKEKVNKKKKRLKVDKLIFLLLQTHFFYFNSSI